MYDFAKPLAQSALPWSRVLQSLREAQRYFGLRRFLLCIPFYQGVIMAVMALAYLAEGATLF